MKYRPEIDGLRALAVMLVVLGHLGVAGLAGGYIGVDVFFVISGFLITSLIMREHRRTNEAGEGWFSVRAFYFRRARRILPMSLLVIGLTVLAVQLTLNPIKAAQVRSDGFWAAVFMANLNLIRQSADYFQHGFSVSPFNHYWSLAVEEQFYLVVPALVVGVIALSRRSGRPRAFWWGMAGLIGAITVASLAYAVFATGSNPTRAYFSSAARAYELGLGALLAVAHDRSAPSLGRWPRELLAGLGVAGIVLSAMIFSETSAVPGWVALVPTAATVAFILACTDAPRLPLAGRLLALPPVVGIGKISYSVYLFHWPLIALLPLWYPGSEERALYPLIVVALTLGLSVLGYLLVERPFRTLPVPRGFSSAGRPSLAGLGLVASAAGLFLFGVRWLATHDGAPDDPLPAMSLERAVGPKAPRAPSPEPAQGILAPPSEPAYVQALAGWLPDVERALELSAVPADLDPPLAELLAQRGAQWQACMDPRYREPTCSFGDPSAPHTAVILGDSYALAIYPMVLAALDEHDWYVVGFNKRECMVADVLPCPWSGEEADERCPRHRAWVFDEVERLQPELIVLSDQLVHPVADGDGACGELNDWMRRAGLKRSLARLASLAPAVVYFGLPTHHEPLSDCVGVGGALTSACSAPTEEFGRYRQMQRAAASEHGIAYIDPTQWLCGQERCPPIIDSIPVYWDGTHFSQRFATRMGPLFRSYLESMDLLPPSAETEASLQPPIRAVTSSEG